MPNPHLRNTLRRHQGKPRVLEENNVLGQEGHQGATHSHFCHTGRGDALEKCSSITHFGDRGEKSEVGNRVWPRSSGEEAPTPASTAQSLPCSQQPLGALQAKPHKATSRNPPQTLNPGQWKHFARRKTEGEEKAP